MGFIFQSVLIYYLVLSTTSQMVRGRNRQLQDDEPIACSVLACKAHKHEPPQAAPAGNAHVQIVIARYNEDIHSLEWVQKYNHIVYNRGAPLVGNFKSEEQTENLGRESFVYLDHIVRNYNNLADITVFLQADASLFPPFINSTALRENVEGLADKRRHFGKKSDGFAFISIYNNCMSGIMASTGRLNNINVNKRYHIDYGADLLNNSYLRYLNVSVQNPRFAPGGMFAVTRQAIHRNSPDYFITLLAVLSESADPPFGHFMERAWPEVFHSSCGLHPAEFHCWLGEANFSC